ncbi:MAG: tyrosine-type recombinase/integrase [Paracoccaceae bacterium]
MKSASIIRRGNALFLRRRVPIEYANIEPRREITVALKTDSHSVAMVKAPQVWEHLIEAWEARLAGEHATAETRFAAAKALAAKRGFSFMPSAKVAELPLPELLARLQAVVNSRGQIDPVMAEAVLGGAKPPGLMVSGALDRYWPISRDKITGKSEDQIRRWRNPRIKAVAAFLGAVGNRSISDISTTDLHAFRAALLDRIDEGEILASSANKDLIHLLAVIKDVAKANDIRLAFDASGLGFKQGKGRTRPPFSAEWIKDKLLAPGAMDGLNGEARAILLGMVNTGYRPSEAAQLGRAQIRLDANVPHISIEPVRRALKTEHSERIIPLAGCSLEAFRAYPDGFPRYADSPSLTDTVNKYLRENGLMETPGHSMYSLRHSFEDRMLRAGVDERVRSDLIGHTIKRQRYGAGADLPMLMRVIQSVAL